MMQPLQQQRNVGMWARKKMTIFASEGGHELTYTPQNEMPTSLMVKCLRKQEVTDGE